MGAGRSPGEGAVCGGCGAPLGEPPTRRGCRETCIPRGLDAAGHAGMLPSALDAGEGASASPSPSITAADAARLDHVVRQQPACFCPASGVWRDGPGLFVWLISKKQSLSPIPGIPVIEPGSLQPGISRATKAACGWEGEGQGRGSATRSTQGRGNTTVISACAGSVTTATGDSGVPPRAACWEGMGLGMTGPCMEAELLGAVQSRGCSPGSASDSLLCKGDDEPRGTSGWHRTCTLGMRTVTGPARLRGITLLPAKVLPTPPWDTAAGHPGERRQEEALTLRDLSPSTNRVQSDDPAFLPSVINRCNGRDQQKGCGQGYS